MTESRRERHAAGARPARDLTSGAEGGPGRRATGRTSAGERFTSYDVEAFEVPGGREENWRFTPLRRLRGLHDGTAPFDGTAVVEIAGAGEGVIVERVDPRRRRASARAASRPTASPPRPGRRPPDVTS